MSRRRFPSPINLSSSHPWFLLSCPHLRRALAAAPEAAGPRPPCGGSRCTKDRGGKIIKHDLQSKELPNTRIEPDAGGSEIYMLSIRNNLISFGIFAKQTCDTCCYQRIMERADSGVQTRQFLLSHAHMAEDDG